MNSVRASPYTQLDDNAPVFHTRNCRKDLNTRDHRWKITGHHNHSYLAPQLNQTLTQAFQILHLTWWSRRIDDRVTHIILVRTVVTTLRRCGQRPCSHGACLCGAESRGNKKQQQKNLAIFYPLPHGLCSLNNRVFPRRKVDP
jgi:hypothetical protein